MRNDGHVVRSKSETLIDDYLFNKKIFHVYEKQIALNEKNIIEPDFYLPDIDVYIEHWGREDEEYQRIKAYKIGIYKEKQFTVITTCEDDIKNNIEAVLEQKLKYIKRATIN